MNRLEHSRSDALLYGGSALVALVVPLTTSAPADTSWARIATGPYLAGAVWAVYLGRRKAGLRARQWLAAGVLVTATLLPLALEVIWRAETGHVKSEVVVTEQGARTLLAGRDPYGATPDSGPLAAWGPDVRDHVPYPPAMLFFGLPRAVFGDGPLADARLAFVACALAAAACAWRYWRRTGERRLRAMQVLLVIATGAPMVATSGKEPAVLALMLLALVLLDGGRPRAAGMAAGVAAATYQLAWLLVPFLGLSGNSARSGRRSTMFWGLTIPALFIGPFLLWSPSAFVRDVILFPFAHAPRPEQWSPTPGAMLVRMVPSIRKGLAVTVAAVVLLLTFVSLRRPTRGAADAAGKAGLILAIGVLFAPGGQAKYLVFPLELLVWSRLLDVSP
jgi:hypothetical protein